MLIDDDNTITDSLNNSLPITEEMLLEYGFRILENPYAEDGDWYYVYTDADENDVSLRKVKSELPEYKDAYRGDVYFPQYNEGPKLRIPDPEHRSIKLKIYNQGDLKKFMEVVNQAAELRIFIGKRSKEIILNADDIIGDDYVIRR